jgi:HEAT repeat protein
VSSIFDVLDGLPQQETVFVVLVATVVLLALLAVGFAINVLIFRLLNDRTARRWSRLEEEWEVPLLEVLSNPESMSTLWDRVEKRDQPRFVDFVLRWTRRVRGVSVDVLREVALPFLDPFTKEAHASRLEDRTRAVQTLGTLGLPKYEHEVLAALGDDSPLVAMVAARSLARMGSAAYAEPILEHLDSFRDWNRNFLSAMLASMGSGAAPALRQTASDEAKPRWVRTVAIDALRHLSDLETADVAAAIVARTEDRELAAAALRLLAEVGRPEHLEVIRERATSGDFVIRAHALSALGALGGRKEIPVLQNAITDPSPWVAIRAARGLYAAGVVEPLRSLAQSSHPRAALARQVLTEEDSDRTQGGAS